MVYVCWSKIKIQHAYFYAGFTASRQLINTISYFACSFAIYGSNARVKNLIKLYKCLTNVRMALVKWRMKRDGDNETFNLGFKVITTRVYMKETYHFYYL